MRIEEWKDIKGYEGLYKVSNLGKIKTLKRRRVKEKIMKPENDKGYYRVSLSKNGKRKHYFIHMLVAKHFVPNYYNLPEINHKDENSFNNCYDNLEWCTHSYNLSYGTRNKKVVEKLRKQINQYSIDGKFIATHYSIQDASRNLKIHAGPICKCCKGKQRTAYGYVWKYVERGDD